MWETEMLPAFFSSAVCVCTTTNEEEEDLSIIMIHLKELPIFIMKGLVTQLHHSSTSGGNEC